jgi:hypothetical protein
MAVTQAFFDPTESYVGGSVFINTLGAFTNRRFAMNQQLLEQKLKQMDPVALNKAMAALQTQIDRQKKGLVTDYDIKTDEVAETFRIGRGKEAGDRSSATRASSADKRAADKRDKAIQKVIVEFDKITAESEINKIAKEIGAKEKTAIFDKVETAEQLQTALNNRFKTDATRKSEAFSVAVSALYGAGGKVKQWQYVPGLNTVPISLLEQGLIETMGLNLTESSGIAAPNVSENYSFDHIKKRGFTEANNEYESTPGVTAPYAGDRYAEAASISARAMEPRYAAAEAHNKQVQAQIDQLEKQKLGLSAQLEKSLSGDTSDLYGGFQELGISNLSLHSPFLQEDPLQRRMGEERSMDIDVDIAGMMPRPKMPEIDIPRRERKPRPTGTVTAGPPETIMSAGPPTIETIPEGRVTGGPSTIDKGYIFRAPPRSEGIAPTLEEEVGDEMYLDEVMPPIALEASPEDSPPIDRDAEERKRAIDNMMMMDKDYFEDLSPQQFANLFTVPLNALLDMEDGFKRDLRNRDIRLGSSGGTDGMRGVDKVDDDIMELGGPAVAESTPDPYRVSDPSTPGFNVLYKTISTIDPDTADNDEKDQIKYNIYPSHNYNTGEIDSLRVQVHSYKKKRTARPGTRRKSVRTGFFIDETKTLNKGDSEFEKFLKIYEENGGETFEQFDARITKVKERQSK